METDKSSSILDWLESVPTDANSLLILHSVRVWPVPPDCLSFFPFVPRPSHTHAVLSTAQRKRWRIIFLMTNPPILRHKRWKYAPMVEKLLPFPARADLFEPSPPKALPISSRYGQKSLNFLAWTNGTNGTAMTRMSRAVSITR